MQYQYLPLSEAEEEIRLAVLEPGSFDDEIRISFKKDQLTNNIVSDYEALSYVWGTIDNPSHACILKNSEIQGNVIITKNLEIALRHQRRKDCARTMWIDALCINQCDDSEKGWQVALMGEIFRRATTVVAWLGPEADNSSLAIENLRQVPRHMEFDWETATLSPPSKSGEADWSDRQRSFPWDSGVLNSMCSLFQRPYFQRLWILPETSLAEKLLICCGHEEMTGEDFWVAVACIFVKPTAELLGPEQLNDYIKAQAAVYYAYPGHHSPGVFQYARFWMHIRGSDCKDPRDRIYAVASLLHPEDQKLSIQPDYTKSVEELYVNVASLIITKRRTLSLFEICDLISRTLKIPTWVPDWLNAPRFKNILFTTWSACGYISSQVLIKDDGITCIAPGVRAAQVESSTDFRFNEDVCDADEMLSVIRSVKPSHDEFLSSYPTGCTCLEAYCYAFSSGRSTDAYSQPAAGLAERSQVQLRNDVNLIWSTTGNFGELGAKDLYYILRYLHFYLVGRCFIKTSNGYIGLAPVGTRSGDVICVILGCKFPVVLRPSSESNQGWLVVGICYVYGLMDGEIIYRGNLPKRYRSVRMNDFDGLYEDAIDGDPLAMYDPDKDFFNLDPANLLEEAGIKVETFDRYPYLLEVLPETLKAAGIALENFTLV